MSREDLANNQQRGLSISSRTGGGDGRNNSFLQYSTRGLRTLDRTDGRTNGFWTKYPKIGAKSRLKTIKIWQRRRRTFHWPKHGFSPRVASVNVTIRELCKYHPFNNEILKYLACVIGHSHENTMHLRCREHREPRVGEFAFRKASVFRKGWALVVMASKVCV